MFQSSSQIFNCYILINLANYLNLSLNIEACWDTKVAFSGHTDLQYEIYCQLTVLYHNLHYCKVPFSLILYCNVLYCTVLYYTELSYALLYCITFYCPISLTFSDKKMCLCLCNKLCVGHLGEAAGRQAGRLAGTTQCIRK